MTIEEIQISIARDVSSLGAHPTEAQQLQVTQCRDKLQAQIDQFSQSAGTFLGHTIDGGNIADSYMDENVIEDNHSDQGDDAPISYSFSFQPEASIIPLPSNLGIARCNEFRLTTLVSQEICLREGQANDALHAICVNLVHKAVIFHKTVRTAKSQVGTTRAWTQVHAVENVISYNARIYSKCHKQLGKLGADDLLEKYRKLEVGDLKFTMSIGFIAKHCKIVGMKK
ncbi:hypothetical protein AZE42_11904 [Rhizopogon vesiculosus]|uniref:Uncharacterized protein n=1 Tax=Rhizopogon vesiculosus TaxID=180088 RepID=A0A1J8PP05_9AGAM|nr:hypothetical protein AZE42_11904 [Rhizopogon vesiculosus]